MGNQIDLGLSVLCAVSARGETLGCKAIAEVCGCSRVYIDRIQRVALMKARRLYEKKGITDPR